ncbi:VOC family protein [Variovorax rhizosphaerae]|uniref:VOC family protein n=1 Tax=Variovorax rhizosphaerae TaxID=1836200 RepID=A0ABU8WXF9_9BURK
MQETKDFYQEILGFIPNEDGTFLFQRDNCKFDVRFRYARAESKGEKSPLFEYSIPKNFPSYCIKLKELGVAFEVVVMTKGGYFGRIIDPSGNPIEITCNEFDDEEGGDISTWSTYKRY